MKESSLYIHIPFCDHKCIYCDFYSIITHDGIQIYLDALKKEIEYFARNYSAGRKFTTIFFGGGTPSLLAPHEIEEIIFQLKNNFTVSKDAEITLETNPGTVDKEKLKDFLKAGINRISIGIQTFDDEELKFLTRIHNKQTAIETVWLAKEVGFKNISLDLIFNLPKQTKEKWMLNLQTAIALPITHLSAYSLILERGTILNKLVLDKKVVLQDEDYDAELHEMTIEFLNRNNFVQYEVSNFALKGFECRHNLAYWQYKNYLGFGTSAHSFVNGKRWWNYSPLKFYVDSVTQKENAVIGEEILSEQQMKEEFIMLALRSKGLNVNEFNEKFGLDWYKKKKNQIETYLENLFLADRNDILFLTPKGYVVCDEIIANLIS
ncbi:MAG: coproporphyrinogen III oxidase [Ignavibacteria bacterium CG_4_8_14_3_um_filter_37_9]|nr:radical SAM family heme chaperone HemW [Ignavibacteria bacterium]OIO14524.1 MAG: coproporphyrinogen III oxidase [Ignavibacteria bacterium CG1_02_37_35]PIW99532.1 MAG: coproporphyrinogen III oxidase [Ignavibacteria bacterium CG_4_8_14_3_um_filter_37_9]PIX93480.1 MAG: coproporphyrinogen III oxidase [Ignavibacteria bacterium CG_4_10_14_3_um_filter_37_18]PJC58010.1 MAG: coproporphyrinogen III oxidase [Ignavibacteria bacterium CG_4_9_14_0_2_um_filter_37_13]